MKLETIKNNTLESPWRLFWKGFKKNKLAVSGTVIIAGLFIIAIFAPFIAPYDQDAIMTKEIPTAAASGTFLIGGNVPVHRLGYGTMRLVGDGAWGEPADPAEAARQLLAGLGA